jgi:hypothetical protein
MKRIIITACLLFSLSLATSAQDTTSHPNTSTKGWTNLFKADLSNAIFPDEQKVGPIYLKQTYPTPYFLMESGAPRTVY